MPRAKVEEQAGEISQLDLRMARVKPRRRTQVERLRILELKATRGVKTPYGPELRVPKGVYDEFQGGRFLLLRPLRFGLQVFSGAGRYYEYIRR